MSPREVVIPVGKHNKFRHPSSAVIERLERAGARVCRTDEEGAIIVETDGSHRAASISGNATIWNNGPVWTPIPQLSGNWTAAPLDPAAICGAEQVTVVSAGVLAAPQLSRQVGRRAVGKCAHRAEQPARQ